VKKKILVIEDDEATAEILCHLADFLKLDCSLENRILSITEIEKHNPDLILLDHRLADGLGSLLSRKIKSTPSTKNICVVLMSAHYDIENIARESLADSYISKPFDTDDLEALIAQCLNLKIE
jgi:DNA-binding response OmpR family regulator